MDFEYFILKSPNQVDMKSFEIISKADAEPGSEEKFIYDRQHILPELPAFESMSIATTIAN